MQYCPHCMKPAAGGGRCPSCGGDVSWTGQTGIDLPVGTVLSGGNGLRTYQIGAARGKGGFGITYIALETNSGRRMAIKEYFPTRCAFRGGNGVDVQAMTGQEEAFRSGMDNFLSEGKMLLSQDDLSCVVHVIDYFQTNGTAYLVMEYLDGVALHTQMTRMGGRIPVNELMPRLALLMRDIGQLHQRGVIHRDISPDNIMWMPGGGLKLLDFGSARSMESGKSMTVLMKQGFSPIEQYRSTGQGPYTDIYALAATIYYCVTGVIPPSSQDRMGEDTLQSPIALGAALTVQQETALLWALSIQPNARPQSMEEFAAMLYKEGPAAAPGGQVPPGRQVPPGGFYSAPPEFRPQSERPPQAQPFTDQNNAYSYNYSGQTAGAYNAQSQAGSRTGGGGGKNKMLPVGAAAAAIVVLLIVGFMFLNRDKTVDTPNPAGRPSQSAAPTRTDAPTPSLAPVQDVVTGVTDDGFRYEMIGRDHVVLTGCEAGANFSYMPDDVDDIPITEIADGAFAGASTGGLVNLPTELETIGANAFRGCTDLSCIYAYSDVAMAANSFSGCDNMWFVAVHDYKDTSGWRLPSGAGLFCYGMETGFGVLASIKWNGSLLTGETEDGDTVLLDVKPGTQTVSGLDDVDWICSWALNDLSSSATVKLGDETLFPYEAFSGSVCTWSAPDGTLSDQWLLSCATASSINAARPNGATQVEPDLELMLAAMIRAAEYAELRDINNRPDNKGDSFTVLTELDITRKMAAMAAGASNEYVNAWNGAREYITEKYASALTVDSSASYAGQYYSRVGVAVNQEYDGRYTWSGYLIIP